jgi:hypothetical protein
MIYLTPDQHYLLHRRKARRAATTRRLTMKQGRAVTTRSSAMLRKLGWVAAGLVLVTSTAGIASPAGADTPPLWRKLGCGTTYHEVNFTVKGSGDNSLELSVAHYPGHFGQLEVKERVGSNFRLVWQWSQPTNWIIGSYIQKSPALSAGSYIAQYWAHNRAQSEAFCSSWLFQGDGATFSNP